MSATARARRGAGGAALAAALVAAAMGTPAGAAAPPFSPGPATAPWPAPPRAAAAASAPALGYALRGIYERDSSATGFDDQAALGFNLIDSGPYRDDLDPLAQRGLKAFVWLGGYSSATCAFVRDDGWIRRRVGAIAEHPAVAAYFVDDEPDAAACPTAPEQMRERSQLVKSIDPAPPTFLALYRREQFAPFAGTVDLLAVDRYPCTHRYGCDFSRIDEVVAELDRLGVRYWGVIQAHGDEWYRVPTRSELHRSFDHWRASRMEGYLVFSWRWPDDRPSLWLANNRRLQRQLEIENAWPEEPQK
jgi:hypothetical protein